VELGLRVGVRDNNFLLRFDNGNVSFGSILTLGIPRKHDFHSGNCDEAINKYIVNYLWEKRVNLLDTKDTLSQKYVTACDVNIIVSWVTTVNHQAVDKLH